MLDAAQPATDLLSAVERWKPDAQCVAAGDAHLDLAIRSYATGMLSDGQIARRVLERAAIDVDTSDRHTAAEAVARHCALMDLPLRQIIAVLAYLAAEVPGWPDADEITAIATVALAEFA